MLFGVMNHPARDPIREIRWAAESGFGFIDLTVEGPRSGRRTLASAGVKQALRASGLAVVGHIGWYYPLDFPTAEARAGILASFLADMAVLADLGAQVATIHLTLVTPARFFGPPARIRFASELAGELVARAAPLGIRPILEHVQSSPDHLRVLGGILARVPELGFHIDLGHTNLRTERNATERLLASWGSRLAHVHASDNFGAEDLHLPIGAGAIDWPAVMGSLLATGYDGTITLEVFSRDREYVTLSREKLARIIRERRG